MKESDLQINQDELDREWVEQPTLYYRYATMLAKARLNHEREKSNIEVARAEVARLIRAKPKKFGIGDKITEAAVKEAILVHKDYTAAVESELKAKYRVDILQATVVALDHRKKALEKLVDLFLANYFSPPRAKGEKSREAQQRMSEQTSERAARKIAERQRKK